MDGSDAPQSVSRGRRTAGHPARRAPGVAGWEPRITSSGRHGLSSSRTRAARAASRRARTGRTRTSS